MARKQSEAYYRTLELEEMLVPAVIDLVLWRHGITGGRREVASEGIERLYRMGFADDVNRKLLAMVDERVGVPLLGRAGEGLALAGTKPKKVSAYHKKYGRSFKKLAPKYKKKNGSWKKNGFKRCAAAARRECKK